VIAASRGASVALAVLFGLLVAPRVGADDAGLPRVPILEFHVVGDPALGAPNVQLYDSAATFRAQLGWLAAHGYRAVTLDQMLRGWQGELKLPRKPVVLTFDDGYPQDVTTVLPLLRAVHWSGVLNLQVGNLVPARVRQLLAAGWEVDAHTFTHPDLTRISAAQLRHEVAGSRRWIRGVFGEPVDFFCYPAGRFDQTVIAEVRRAGYLGAESELPGPASPADGFYALHRIEILRDDGVSGMIVKMR
jgi:peptidoglycan/xylan/chitin deacetylase (PgdA/CDA1 family)